MKRSDKYNYVQVSRSTDQGSRTYDVSGTKLPSVTTILDATSDKTHLIAWRQRVGEEKAKQITKEAAGVGIVTKQNATKDVPVGGEYMNVKKLGLSK